MISKLYLLATFSLLASLSTHASIVHVPKPTHNDLLFDFYPDRAPAHFIYNEIFKLHDACESMIANGSNVTVAQIESNLAANTDIIAGKAPLPDPDIVNLIDRPLKLAERGPTKKRVLQKVVDFVDTFIKGIAA